MMHEPTHLTTTLLHYFSVLLSYFICPPTIAGDSTNILLNFSVYFWAATYVRSELTESTVRLQPTLSNMVAGDANRLYSGRKGSEVLEMHA